MSRRVVLAAVLAVAWIGGPGEASIPEDPVAPGTQLWKTGFNGAGNGDDAGRIVAVSPDGATVFVTGSSTGAGGSGDVTTAAYVASSGAQRWVARLSGPGSAFNLPLAMAVSPDGSRVFVTGLSFTNDSDFVTVAYDATSGAQRWVARFNGPSNSSDSATAVAVSPDSATVFVTGRTFDVTGGGNNYATFAYAAATGTQRWIAFENGPANSSDVATAIGVSPDGGTVFVTGASQGTTTSSDYATVAYTATTGARRWTTRFNSQGSSFDQPSAMVVSASSIFVTGVSNRAGGINEYATVSYSNSSGTQRWVARSEAATPNVVGFPSIASFPGALTVFVTGPVTAPAGDLDYATVAYAGSNGEERWAATFDGPAHSHDLPRSVAVSPNEAQVVVTGASTGPNSVDFATVSYDARTGALRWVARFNGSANQSDVANSIAVSPDSSKIFVTGVTAGTTGGFEYMTIGYRASTCAAGHDERGFISRQVHEVVESPLASTPVQPFVHGINCDVIAQNDF